MCSRVGHAVRPASPTLEDALIQSNHVTRRRRPWQTLVALLLTGVVLGVFAAGNRPGTGTIPPGGDSAAYLAQAASIVSGQDPRLVAGAEDAGRYTPGFALVLAPFVALGGVTGALWVELVSALLLGGVAATLAWRLAGPLAAPLAAALVLFNSVVALYTRWVMTDVPAAAVVVSEVALLSAAPGPAALVVAGGLAGALVWLRPASVVLVGAGLLGLTAAPAWRRSAAWYLAGALPFAALLLAWQWASFGSPLVTSYQAAGASPENGADLTGFFNLRYVVGPPWNSAMAGLAPNVLAYPVLLVGLDDQLLPVGVGLVGLLAAAMLARSPGRTGIVGRATLATAGLLLLVYVPYFWRGSRFLLGATSLLGIVAAAGVITLMRRLVPRQ
jgi:hypothetical protein